MHVADVQAGSLTVTALRGSTAPDHHRVILRPRLASWFWPGRRAVWDLCGAAAGVCAAEALVRLVQRVKEWSGHVRVVALPPEVRGTSPSQGVVLRLCDRAGR